MLMRSVSFLRRTAVVGKIVGIAAMLTAGLVAAPAHASPGPTAAPITESSAGAEESSTIRTGDHRVAASGVGVVRTKYGTLNVRRGASSVYDTNGTRAEGTRLTLQCYTYGHLLTGPMGTSRLWFKIGTRKYVSKAYIHQLSGTSKCSEPRTNDYPYSGCPAVGTSPDRWGFTRGQCTSFAAWRAEQRLGQDMRGLGAAHNWNNRARDRGISTGTTPIVGSIAVMEIKPGAPWGHVAYVSKVNADGSFVIEEKNWDSACGYGVRTVTQGNSLGQFSSFVYA